MGSPDQPQQPHGQGQPESSGTPEPSGQRPGSEGDFGQGESGPGGPGGSQAPGGYQPAPGYQQAPGYQAAGGYQEPGGYPGQPMPGKTNGMAISSLVCGVAQFLLWFFILVPGFVAAVLALIFGVVGLGQIKRRGEGGRGMAIAGIVLGVLGVLSGIAWIIIFLAGTRHFHYHMGNY